MQKIQNKEKFGSKLEHLLNENLFDQEDAVRTLSKTLLQNSLLNEKGKVRALFTFLGPANSGKHYLAQLLAELDESIDAIKSFNLERYSGNFPLGMESLGTPLLESEVIAFVKENPRSVLFFEDIEKGDLQIQLSLHALFSNDQKIDADFSNVIVILSTTRLSALIQRQDFRELMRNDPLQAHTFLMERLKKEKVSINGNKEEAFDKKLLSLLNEHTIVTFRLLGLKALIKIGARALHETSQHFTKQSSIEVEYDDFEKVISLLTLSLSPYINARHIIKKVPEVVFDEIYEAVKQKENTNKIVFEASADACSFADEILKDPEALVKKVSKQHKRITLEWEYIVDKKSVICRIKNAFYSDEKLSTLSEDLFHISDVSFNDVAGQQRVKKELQEVLALLKEPKRLQHFDMTPPKGMFLYGPQGMGKKLLARAFAYESDMPYAVISGADLFDDAKIHRIYTQAYNAAPSIVIVEDMDVQGLIGNVISRMNTAPLVEEIDSLSQSFEAPVFTIATVSDISNIPDDLSRAGRIDIRIEVPKLDMEARRFFIEELFKKPHDKNIDVERVVRYISGLGGNELKRIGQQASLQCARKGLKKITEEILLEQINIIKYGTKLENKQIRDIETSMAKTAYHEAGHAVLSYVLLPNVKIEQVTVAPRSETLGFVSYHNDDYVDATSKEELFNDICVLLAGRIAKMEKFGESGMETGAISDLEVANMQIYAAIALFGMDDELGYVNVSGIESVYDKKVFSKKIEERMLVWLKNAEDKTRKEVKKLWKAIDAVAKELIQKEVIDGEELKSLIDEAVKQKKKR